MKIARLVLGLFVGFVVLAVTVKVTVFLVGVLGALALGAIGIHVSESERALYNLESAASILGFLAAVYVAYRCYRWISPAGTTAVPSAN